MARRHSDDYDRHPAQPTPLSFADLIDRLQQMPDLSPTRRRDVISAVRRTGANLGQGRPLIDIRPHPAWIRRRTRETAPAAHGLTRKSWQNLTSDLNRAPQICGVTRGIFRVPLTGDWADLQRKIRLSEDKSLGTGLSRFPRFCQSLGVAPEAVSSETILAYYDHLMDEEIIRDPQKAAYYAARGWNRATDSIDGWPGQRVDVPKWSKGYAYPWSAFPASLEVAVDAWLARAGSDDIFDLESSSSPSAPSTRKGRKGAIQRFASALVHDGVDAMAFRTLADLVDIDTVTRGLRWLMTRLGGKPTGGLGNVAIALKLAARWHVKVKPTHLDRLSTLVKRIYPHQKGMVEKNRKRIEPFKDHKTVFTLLTLPERMIAGLARMKSPARRAARFETALAIAILTYCPVRFANLRGIEIDCHIVRYHGGPQRGRILLQFPDTEVKNRSEIALQLPQAIAQLIDVFLDDQRPELVETPSRFLFSKRSGDAPISATALSRRITEAIRDDLGLTLTPHNFRHLAGLVYLQVNPGDYDVVRRVQGTSDRSTATDAYTGLETDAAHKVYTSLLDHLRVQHHG